MGKADKSSTDGVRRRNKSDNSSANGEGDGKSSSSNSKKPASNGAGMTCMNWFIVLVLIAGVSGGTSFFVYNEMKTMNKVLLQQLKQQSESLDISGIGGQLKSMAKKLSAVEELKGDLADVKENQNKRATEFEQVASQIKKFQQTFTDLSTKSQQSLQSIETMKKDVDTLKTTTRSIQKETIDLTADKVAMSSAIDSMKTTIVMVRDNLNKLQTGKSEGDTSDIASVVEKRIEDLDAKVTEEVTRLGRQLSETSENSATWLQQSTNEMNEKFHRRIEELTKQLSEVKVKAQEPSQATPDESLVNIIGSLNNRLDDMVKAVDTMKKSVGAVEEKQNAIEDATAIEFEEGRDSLGKLTARVMEVKGRDEKMEAAMETMTKLVTSLTNELNGVKTTARILETRMEEIRTKEAAQPPQPAAAPDKP